MSVMVSRERAHTDPFRALVERDLRNTTTDNERALLRHPDTVVRWLRMLKAIQREVESHIGRNVAALRAMAPAPGDQPSREYIVAKRTHDAGHAKRINFVRHLKTHMDEAVQIINHHGLPPLMVGNIVDFLVDVDTELAGDDIEAARGKINGMIATLRHFKP
jgi:hypothetical protein